MEGNKRGRLDSKQHHDRKLYLSKRPRGGSPGPSSSKRKECSNALVLDNGGFTIKIGYSKDNNITVLPNHIMKAKSERKRFFIADQIEDCRDLSGLYYLTPHDHGYISKFDVQKNVWDYTFNKFPADDMPVIVTQPIFNFKHIQEYMDEIFFEEYDVKTLYRTNSTDLTYYQYITTKKGQHTSCIIVDSGYSFTHIVPYVNGKKYTNGIIRMDIGGKLLTNYLKDILSYRQLHVMEETYVINQLKEDTCYMALDFKKEMQTAKTTNDIVKNYVLPDFHNIRRGYVHEGEVDSQLAENFQILRINNERISVPEVLMKPSIIPGIEQAGLAQCIAKSIAKCPTKYRQQMADNIILVGGNTNFPGFKERVETETRMFLPSHHRMTVFKPEEPIKYSVLGGKSFSKDPQFRSMCVKKHEYEEHGSNYTYKKFNEFVEIEEEPPKKTEEAPFSYLDHWKKEGVDIFQKNVMKEDPSPDVQFILEGDDIEQYDGKYVTIEFEYEKKQPPKVEIPPPPIKPPDISQLKVIKKKMIVPNSPLVLNSNATVVRASDLQPIRAPTKVYRPVFRTKPENQKITQIISINGATPMTSGPLIIPSTSGGKTVSLGSAQLLNNAVIIPQNMFGSKNLTLQFRPIFMQGNNIIITKKQ
ncbi:PREDICTED: actin-related protein 6 [Nicrophorus vespilloides]|uniref:Actin-related protein 6 n=1 Tax=Nicrophorus vespilloides TaxID=110193 RepID=A0ABM1MDI7_NICVS|nr:PREDICTED: actin-related protein 6 [Nicrophorus vespilloides]